MEAVSTAAGDGLSRLTCASRALTVAASSARCPMGRARSRASVQPTSAASRESRRRSRPQRCPSKSGPCDRQMVGGPEVLRWTCYAARAESFFPHGSNVVSRSWRKLCRGRIPARLQARSGLTCEAASACGCNRPQMVPEYKPHHDCAGRPGGSSLSMRRNILSDFGRISGPCGFRHHQSLPTSWRDQRRPLAFPQARPRLSATNGTSSSTDRR